MQDNGLDRKEVMALAAEIVAAYVGGNSIADRDLPGLIRSVHAALMATDQEGKSPPAPALVPAVSIKKSITPDYIICLEDGKRFKSLRRHIMSKYGLTPEAYRSKWDLAPDYPMVAPNYALARSTLAKRMGLGTKKAPPAKPAKSMKGAAGKPQAAPAGRRKRSSDS